MLKGKRILLGVTASIAAYKAAILVRALCKAGAQVKVVMTPMAKEFITPLTMATLARGPILVDFFNPENGDWNSHISLGEWADAYVIAPASANTLAKMATGVADNLLLTTYLSARCPVFVSPAMDLDMYAHITTKRNLETLSSDGVEIIEPQSGFLASGLEGKGRMEEPEEIAKYLANYFERKATEQSLAGKHVVISVGGTVEHIDPVRYISNHSSGQMGYALAHAAKMAGARVTIIRASVDKSLIGSLPGVSEVEALSALDMHGAAMQLLPSSDVVIMAAAVADYRTREQANTKIKKETSGETITLELVKNPDIAAAISAAKQENQMVVGFALESDNEVANALSKLERKGLDMIVLNSLKDKGCCFGTAENKVTIFHRDGSQQEYEQKSKAEVARDIITQIGSKL